MPKNTGAGVILAGLSMICGFALIWHIWWLAVAAFAGVIGGVIIHTFNYHRDYHIPADEVARVESERGRLLAQQA
jgi:cytochrome o ubiquinol oxidase subunit 1